MKKVLPPLKIGGGCIEDGIKTKRGHSMVPDCSQTFQSPVALS